MHAMIHMVPWQHGHRSGSTSKICRKIADLIVVNGRPAAHVSDLRKSELVIRGGRLYNVAGLRAAVKGP